jgi:hypothetical protein
MALVKKIDSNITGLAYAEEAVLGLLPGEGGQGGSPVWNRLNPNSYSDTGGEVVTVAPTPINPSRQRRKGVAVDLNADVGFNHNLTFFNLQDLKQGLFFADTRAQAQQNVTLVDIDTTNPDEYEVALTAGFIVNSLIKGFNFANAANNAVNVVTAITTDVSVEVADGQLVDETPPADAYIKVVGHIGAAGDIDVDNSGSLPTLTSTTLDFTTLGLVPGQWIFIGSDTVGEKFANAANNGFKRIRSIAANVLTLDKSELAMITEASTTETIHLYFGDVLRNESGTLIKRRSYNVERTLGAPDDAQPAQIQSEVMIGSVPNEYTLNIPTANLVAEDWTFVAIDNVQRTGVTGPKQSSVQITDAAKEYNTSSDVARIKLAIVSDTDPAPTDLFAFVTEATITVNNNVSPNKAVGVFGAFDVTAGTFEVSGSLTAYFADVTAVQSVRNSDNITLDISFVKDNTALVWDIPLIGLGDGRLNVELDQPITLPLTTDAASGEDVDPGLDHTALITSFFYVPNAA